LVFLGVR